MKNLLISISLVAAGLAPLPAMAGNWSTSYGTMQLPDQPRPGALRAPYSDDNGRIIGQMQIPKCFGCGPEVRGVWVERSSGKKCGSAKDGSYYWGSVELTFNGEYTTFSGHWNYCGSGGTRSWSGRRGGTRLPQKPSK